MRKLHYLKMVGKKKIDVDGPATLPPNGTCITLQASNPHKWWSILADRYYQCDSKEEAYTDCIWNDVPLSDTEPGKIKETHIKYADTRTDFAITIIIFFSTGAINIQGKHKNLEIWIKEHYPALKRNYDAPPPEKGGEKSANNDITAKAVAEQTFTNTNSSLPLSLPNSSESTTNPVPTAASDVDAVVAEIRQATKHTADDNNLVIAAEPAKQDTIPTTEASYIAIDTLSLCSSTDTIRTRGKFG